MVLELQGSLLRRIFAPAMEIFLKTDTLHRARCLSFYGTGVYKIVKEGIDGEAGNGLDTCLACDIFPM